jgi:hypothetical protein
MRLFADFMVASIALALIKAKEAQPEPCLFA